MSRLLVLLAAVTALAVPASASAQAPGIGAPINDLFALGQGSGDSPPMLPLQHNAEPPLVATPRAKCAPGTRTEPGIQGRVPNGANASGALMCNLSLVAHQGSSGGFRVWRYTDDTGRTCAFYDTALLFPSNAIQLGGRSLGVAVLDMSDPAHPVQTDTLTELPMLSPHESFNVNAKRGLLAAVLGNPMTYPGLVSIYDAHADCRHPVLQSTTPAARFGHESGFSQDGKTFYVAGTGVQSIAAIDVTDPKAPHAVWQGNIVSHGLSLSDDGNRAYIADATGGNMLILDTSQIQARTPNPVTREVSRLTWTSASIPQNAIPFTEDGHPYVLEFDEYTGGTTGSGNPDAVGAGRIIDVADENHPHVVANLRLQVDQEADHAAARTAGDPGTTSPVQGYAGHYCNVPTRTDPKVVACSFIASGLRVFDISDLVAPKEIAYFVAPKTAEVENGYDGSNYAMSQPAFDVARHDVWYSDGASGFYNVHLDDAVWPAAHGTAGSAGTVASRKCGSRRTFLVTARAPKGARVRGVTATLAGKRVRTTRRGRTVKVRVKMLGLPRKTVHLVVRIKLRGGRTVTDRRTYHPCRHTAPRGS